jgi:outer membrane protein assembly factor BamB
VTQIELDVSTPWEPPEPPLRRHHALRWLAVGLLLAALLVVVGGARPAPSLDPVATIEADGITDFRVTGDRLFVLRQISFNRVDLEAYRLHDGTRLWRTPLDSPADFVDVAADRVVLNGSPGGRDQATVLTAIDAVTGAEAWRRPGYAPAVFHLVGGGGTVVTDPTIPTPDEQPTGPAGRVRQLIGLDIRTGAARWTLTTPRGTLRSFLYLDSVLGRDDTLNVEADSVRFAVGELAPDGTLTVHSAADGSVTRTAKIDMPARVDSFDVFGDRLITYEAGEDIVPTGAVFDLRTGHRLWALPSSQESGPVWGCRPLLCSGTESSIAVLDPDTGRVRWQLDQWVSVQAFGGHMLAMRMDGNGGNTASDPMGALVLDTTSGRLLRRVVGWDPIGPESWPNLIVMRRSANNGGAVIGRLNVDSGEVEIFARAERWYSPPTCFTAAKFLVCRNGVVSIWRLPS